MSVSVQLSIATANIFKTQYNQSLIVQVSIVILSIRMEIPTASDITGWTALTEISCFQTHAELKKQLNIFGQLDAWLDYLEYLIRIQLHKADHSRLKDNKRKKQLAQQLAYALKSLKNDERIYYYNTMVDLITRLINNQLAGPQIQNRSFLIIQSYTRSYNLKIWKQKKLLFDRQNHIIYAQKDKKIKIYDLANYIVRRSNNTHYFCIVLEAINSVPLEKSKTVHIGFQFKNSYNLWLCSIQSSVKYKLWQRIGAMLGKKNLIRQQIAKQDTQSLSKSTNQGHPYESHSFVSQPTTTIKNNLVHSQYRIGPISQSDVSISVQNSQDTSYQHPPIKKINQSSQQLDGQIKLLRTTFTNRLINQHMDVTLQELHCQCQRQSEELKIRKRKTSIYRIVLQSYKLKDIQSTQQYKQITMESSAKVQGQFDIYQQTNNPSNFKVSYKYPNKYKISSQTILHYFLQNKQPSLNDLFKIQIKCVVLSQNITVNLQTHPSYNRLYRPRQFLYLRHLLTDTSNNHYIIDRSIEQPIVKRTQSSVRAHLFRVTKLQINPQHIKITIDFTMRFNGQLSNQQQFNHFKKYIQNLALFLRTITNREYQKPKQIIFYDCHRIQHYQIYNKDQQEQTSINVSIGQFQNDSYPMKDIPNIRKETSFYHIPRNILQDSQTNQSLLLIEQHHNTPNLSITNRSSYSLPHKYIQHHITQNNHSLLQQIKQKAQNSITLIPLWCSQWQVDEQRGGLTQKGNNPKQKKIFKEILQNLSRFTLIGKDISLISFPVQILTPQSTLERIVKTLGYAPYIFNNINQTTALQKLKQTIVLGISISLLSLNIQKSFRTHIGQTFQINMANNCLAYGEQISANPQIAALLLQGQGYSINACVQSKLQVMLNSLRVQNKGTYSVQFDDGVKINFILPQRQLSGLCFDQRLYKLMGKSYYWLDKECLLLQLDFQGNNHFIDNHRKHDQLQGFICLITPQSMNNFILHKQRPKESEIVKRIQRVKGRWTKTIIFETHTVDLHTLTLTEISNSYQALQSDSSFRSDINGLKNGNPVLSQQVSLQLSTQQRKDEQLRKNYSKSYKCN